MIKHIVMTLLLTTVLMQEADDDLVDITRIPMFPQDYAHKIYSGYLNLSSTKAFHYMYVESQHDPYNDPTILWLNGGPGCSSLMGMFTENGPFQFVPNTNQLQLNAYAWNLKANVIYLESPSGVGFSTGGPGDLVTNDNKTAQDNLIALRVFFGRFPNLKKTDFYIAGESYAGIYVPTLAQQILFFNDDSDVERINLKGILVGNPCTHPNEVSPLNKYGSRYTYEYLYRHGFLDEDQWLAYRGACSLKWGNDNCNALLANFRARFVDSGVNPYNIYGYCYHQTKTPQMLQYQRNNPLGHPLNCSDSKGMIQLMNTNEYRDPLHINALNDTLLWTPCSDVLKYTVQPEGSLYIYPSLITAGVKVMVFTGDNDAVVPITGTKSWVQQLRHTNKYPIKRPWRAWITNSQNISGMIWEMQGLTFATVRGAGHLVPTDKPAEAYAILDNFINDNQFAKPDDVIQ